MSRRAVACEICGQMFFPASLKIHQKSCRERQAKTITECPHCNMEMPQADVDDHLRKCKKAIAAREKAAEDGCGTSAMESATSRLPDGRIACQFCGRGFAANRVTDHMAICGKLKQARPRGRDGTATQVPDKVYDGSTADFAPRESGSAEHRSSSVFGTPKPATQPGSAKKSPESSRENRAPHSPSSEVDADGWRAKHREFIDAIRNARRAKTSPGPEGAEPVQAFRAPSTPDSPAVAAPPPPAASAGAGHEARLEIDLPPTPKPAAREKPAVQRQKGAVAKAAAAEDRRRQRPQLSAPVGDWEATSAAAADLLSPQSTGREASTGQSLSPVLRRASAPSSCTPTGGQSAGFPLTPSSRDDRPTPGTEEDREFVDPMGDWIPGDHVQVQGLVNARELNGQNAVLLDFDLDAGCWLVRLENGVVKAMRSEHMTKVPAKTPPVPETPEPSVGTGRSPSPGSRQLSSSTRGPSPPKRLAPKTQSFRPSASVGPRRLKAMQTPEPGNDPAGKRPPKAPRPSSAEPRRAPCDSPRPRRNESSNEVRVGGGRLAESARGSAAGLGKHASASPEDDAPTKEVPAAISRSFRSRRTNEAPRACSKAASVPYISSVPEDSCPPQHVPPLEFAQSPKEKPSYRGFAPGRGAAKAVAAMAGKHEGGSDHIMESPPPHVRRSPSESPRVTGSLPEVLDSPAHPPLDSPLASKGHGLPENTDGIDERQPASEPPLSGRAETASLGTGTRAASGFDGTNTPLSARAMVPATIQFPTHVQGPSWTGPLQGASAGYTPAAASTAPALQVHQASATYAPHSRHTLTPSWGGAGGRIATSSAPMTPVPTNMEAMTSVRASTRQLHTPSMTPSMTPSLTPCTTPMGPAPGHFMAPHPPASLCLFGGSAQMASTQQLQPQACALGHPTAVQQPHPLSSPVMRTQPRRAA